MKYVSTRGQSTPVTLSQAMLNGLASDGGLFVPETIPTINLAEFSSDQTYADFCAKVLAPYFAGDQLEDCLLALCQESFTFSPYLNSRNATTTFMELFHGPTLSFKDFGARFLASSLSRLAKDKKITVIVATSGDTGSAVAAAFYQKPDIDVIVLFPENKISPRQQTQITCWGDNIRAFAVKGVFDDCQRLLKDAFADPWWQQKKELCTSNSINLGRLLPQICYYAYCSLQGDQTPSVIVPSGNLGNVTAAYYAKAMGFPLGDIVIASNANRVISDYLQTGEYQPKLSIATLANAMDVGQPSNFERLHVLFESFDTFRSNVQAYSVTDQEITETIKSVYDKLNYLICPHTATAYFVREQLPADQYSLVVATADPCKFETVIEPIIQIPVPPTPVLAELLARETQFEVIDASGEALKAVIQ